MWRSSFVLLQRHRSQWRCPGHRRVKCSACTPTCPESTVCRSSRCYESFAVVVNLVNLVSITRQYLRPLQSAQPTTRSARRPDCARYIPRGWSALSTCGGKAQRATSLLIREDGASALTSHAPRTSASSSLTNRATIVGGRGVTSQRPCPSRIQDGHFDKINMA